MTDRPYRKPADEIRRWADKLLDRNDYTRGGKAAELYLSPHYLVVRVSRPRVIEGTWEDVSPRGTDEADLLDMLDDWRAEHGRPDIP